MVYILSVSVLVLFIAMIVLIIITVVPKGDVDGKWTKWSDWTLCDVTCGNGTQTRTRSCSNSTPAHGGAGCTGENIQNEKCIRQLCPVIYVGWTKLGTWSTCTVTCGGGTQIRTRICTNPKPSDLGEYCIGDPIHIQSCSQERCSLIDGEWTNWGTWSTCTLTCGEGTQIRTRTCANPKPSDQGEYCIGDPIHIQSCSQKRCSPTDVWTKWSDWTSCDVTCGNGTQTRTRSCTNPTPTIGGAGCIGESVQNETCSKQLCPVIDGGWTNWVSWSTCTVTCGGGTQIRTRTCTNPKPSDLGEYCIGNAIHIQSCSQSGCSPIASAFSVYNPNTYRSFNGTYKLTFSTTIYQHGGDFDKSTGTFNCSIPGTYHFSVTLVKKRDDTRVDRVYCSLYKSRSEMIYIMVDPTDDDTDKGSAAISQSIVTHLIEGNTVYLGDCRGRPSSFMEYWSSFTGFLLYPDN